VSIMDRQYPSTV